MTTHVYIDGFNLYYRALKGTPYKWLDLEKLCAVMLPGHTINRIHYFTAKVKSPAHDPDAGNRQQVYLRAIATLPKVQIHYGHFLESTPRMPAANPPPNTVEVIKREEKGSDVNLATCLLVDAFRGNADTFVVVTNDSDLKMPLSVVRNELGLKTGLLNPATKSSKALMACNPSFFKRIRPSTLAACQLPNPVITPDGKHLTKPATWP